MIIDLVIKGIIVIAIGFLLTVFTLGFGIVYGIPFFLIGAFVVILGLVQKSEEEVFAKARAEAIARNKKYCPNCGREIPNKSIMCPYCGIKI